jgi:hypothetical protein
VFDGEEFVCPECSAVTESLKEEQKEYIRSYSYKPNPKYYGDFQKDLLLGIELEVDNGGEDSRKAKELLKIFNGEEEEKFVYVKHDGSLHSGLEIVSHPATLLYHLDVIPWGRAFEFLRNNGYDSDNVGTCGLHVHINRLFLGKTYRSITTVEARLLFFVETFWSQLVKFSRRTEYQLSRWSNRYGTTDYELALEYNMESRYYALNFQNKATIEFRLFRGTLDPKIFEATLKLVHYITKYCKKHGIRTIKQNGWCGFLDYVARHDTIGNVDLARYLIDRGIWW